MEPPLLHSLLLALLASASSSSWPLAHAAEGASAIGVGVEELGSSSRQKPSVVDLRNFRNAHTRRLLQGGGRNHHAAPVEPPTPAPVHRKHKHHKRAEIHAPVPSPSPSPSVAPRKASPSSSASKPAMSPSSSHPRLDPPHKISPSPSIPEANHDPRVDASVHSTHKHSWRHHGLVAAGSAAFLVMAAASVVYCRVKRVGTVRPWATGLSGQLQRAFVTGVPALKRSELEAACEDFSNIIGSLSSCMLYKGTLSSGVEIAVMSTSIESGKDWTKECESQYREKITYLSRVSHKNFMNLLGYCEEEQPFTRAMVFEYAPNGTLFEHLHVREGEKLDWRTRLRIAMGIAYCLEHMHQLDPPVLPRKLDSTTVYLTDDFAAKVCDLGFWSDDDKGEEASPSASESDMVRQYGVMLVEMLSGRAPVSEEDVAALGRCLDGETALSELMDPSLGSSFPEAAARAVCEVARWCMRMDGEAREMAQVAGRMREITAMGPEGATPKVSPLWWAELELMSAADADADADAAEAT